MEPPPETRVSNRMRRGLLKQASDRAVDVSGGCAPWPDDPRAPPAPRRLRRGNFPQAPGEADWQSGRVFVSPNGSDSPLSSAETIFFREPATGNASPIDKTTASPEARLASLETLVHRLQLENFDKKAEHQRVERVNSRLRLDLDVMMNRIKSVEECNDRLIKQLSAFEARQAVPTACGWEAPSRFKRTTIEWASPQLAINVRRRDSEPSTARLVTGLASHAARTSPSPTGDQRQGCSP